MAKTLAGAVFAAMLIAPPFAANAQGGPTAETPAATQPPAPPLLIGSGDLIDVSIFDSPELSGRFRVDQKGDVEMPLIDAAHVACLTSDQAAKLIEDRYVQAQILVQQSSRSTVFIEEYANQGITVSGEVKTPGIYPAFGVRMLNDVVTTAGGPTPAAAAKAIITRRNDREHPMTVPYNPEAHSTGSPDVQIFPGDAVLLPRAGIVYVLGDVNKAGGFLLDGHETLTAEKAMALAGGQGRAAAMRNVQLVRSLPGGAKEMITIPLDRIYAGKAPDIALHDGDIMYVPVSTGKLATQQAIASALGIGTAVTVYKTAYQ